jgi:hypothetical protein
MATTAKFYMHNATTTNTGTMPSVSPCRPGKLGAGTEATGATTARAADDVIGSANPDTESSITAEATTNPQRLGHRRFVSAPLAAQSFASGDGNWTFSFARSESNTNHNGAINCEVYCWRPSSGAEVGGAGAGTVITFNGTTMVATAETAESHTGTSFSQTIIDGDILVFDVWSSFGQGMSSAYTDQFAYDGTTEASTTTCASFVTPPAPLTLFTAAVNEIPNVTVARTRT